MRLCRIGDRADSLFLRRKAAPLGAEELKSEYFRRLKQGMLLTVRDTADEGVGIAAPQVGVSRRLIAVQRFDKPGEPFECYVNPEIVGRSAARTAGREGCLSVPETSGTVLRADRIVLRYLDETTLRPVLICTQNILLGSLRIQEFLQDMQKHTDNYQNLVYEYISNDLHTFSELYLKDHKIKNIIAVGNQLRTFVKYLTVHNFGHLQPTDSKGKKKDSVSRQEYDEFYEAISSQHPEDLAKELNTSVDQASLLLPTAMIYHNIFEETGAEQMWLSGITLCEGMAADFAERKERITPAHSFLEDIIHTARSTAARYDYSRNHCEYVENAALKIFDAVKRQQNMTKHDRLLLQIAVILHNCGSFINLNEVDENSYKIIMSTELIGISHKERVIVATAVRYLRDYFPEYSELQDGFDKEDYVRIAKLNAILRLADAMDRSHKQKFTAITTSLRRQTLTITGSTLYDITLEQGIFRNHSDFFEEVFGIQPILKQKKTMTPKHADSTKAKNGGNHE